MIFFDRSFLWLNFRVFACSFSFYWFSFCAYSCVFLQNVLVIFSKLAFSKIIVVTIRISNYKIIKIGKCLISAHKMDFLKNYEKNTLINDSFDRCFLFWFFEQNFILKQVFLKVGLQADFEVWFIFSWIFVSNWNLTFLWRDNLGVFDFRIISIWEVLCKISSV